MENGFEKYLGGQINNTNILAFKRLKVDID